MGHKGINGKLFLYFFSSPPMRRSGQMKVGGCKRWDQSVKICTDPQTVGMRRQIRDWMDQLSGIFRS